MGDTIGTQGMTTVSPGNSNYDRRHWRDRNSEGWSDITIETTEAIVLARQRMGLPPIIPGGKLTPLKFVVEPAAARVFIKDWDTSVQTPDERFLEILNRRPCPVYLRRGVNQILLHNRKA